MKHPTTRAERRAIAQRCRNRAARRHQLARRVVVLFTAYRMRLTSAAANHQD